MKIFIVISKKKSGEINKEYLPYKGTAQME